jgi:hypothetical protein
MTEQQQIDKILLEANAYGVKEEVEQLAAFFIIEGWQINEAYQQAYSDIIYFFEN